MTEAEKSQNRNWFKLRAEKIILDNDIDLSTSDTARITQDGIEYVYRNGKPVRVNWNEIIRGKSVERSLNL